MPDQPILEDVGVRRQVRFGGITVLGRRRRPSGAADPLPRDLRARGRFWLLAGVFVVAVWGSLYVWSQTSLWWTYRDLEVLRWLESVRSATLTAVAEAVHALGSVWAYRPIRWAVIAALIAVKRWRQLIAFLASILLVQLLAETIGVVIGRARPIGIEIIGDWEGFAHPSLPITALTSALEGLFVPVLPVHHVVLHSSVCEW